MSLTENQLKALKPKEKPYKVADERGLYVEVAPTGGKLWRYRYRIGKVEKKLSIGTYPDLSLKQARQAALEARMVVSKGGDPALDKRKMSIGVQKGPPIGAQKGPPCGMVPSLILGASFALLVA